MTPATLETLRALGVQAEHRHKTDPAQFERSHRIGAWGPFGYLAGYGDTEAEALAELLAKVNAHVAAPRCECCGQEVAK